MSSETRAPRLEPKLRKAHLIEATLVCLKRHGFHGTSIRKICAEAEVSVGLINHHYEGKDELVAEAYLSITDQIMSHLCEAIDTAAPSPRSKLSAFFRASFSNEILDPQLLEVWLPFWGAVKTSRAINQAHDQSYGEYRALLADALSSLAERESWSNFDAPLAAIALSALLDGLWLEYGLNPNTFTPSQGVQICEAWVDGLHAGGHRMSTNSSG